MDGKKAIRLPETSLSTKYIFMVNTQWYCSLSVAIVLNSCAGWFHSHDLMSAPLPSPLQSLGSSLKYCLKCRFRHIRFNDTIAVSITLFFFFFCTLIIRTLRKLFLFNMMWLVIIHIIVSQTLCKWDTYFWLTEFFVVDQSVNVGRNSEWMKSGNV